MTLSGSPVTTNVLVSSSALISRIRNIAFFTFLTVAIGLFGMAMIKNKFFPPKSSNYSDKYAGDYLPVENNQTLSAGKASEVKNSNNESQSSKEEILERIKDKGALAELIKRLRPRNR